MYTRAWEGLYCMYVYIGIHTPQTNTHCNVIVTVYTVHTHNAQLGHWNRERANCIVLSIVS